MIFSFGLAPSDELSDSAHEVRDPAIQLDIALLPIFVFHVPVAFVLLSPHLVPLPGFLLFLDEQCVLRHQVDVTRFQLLKTLFYTHQPFPYFNIDEDQPTAIRLGRNPSVRVEDPGS
jgi:hypothetical protein